MLTVQKESLILFFGQQLFILLTVGNKIKVASCTPVTVTFPRFKGSVLPWDPTFRRITKTSDHTVLKESRQCL